MRSWKNFSCSGCRHCTNDIMSCSFFTDCDARGTAESGFSLNTAVVVSCGCCTMLRALCSGVSSCWCGGKIRTFFDESKEEVIKIVFGG